MISRSKAEGAQPLTLSRRSVGVITLLLLAAPAAGTEGEQRDCALATVKPCVDTLLEQANNNVIAHATNSTLLDTCRRIQEAMKCVSDYISSCSTKAEREQFTKTVSSTSGLMDSLCQPGEFQDQFLKHVPCLRLVSIDYNYCGHLYKKLVAHIERGEDRNPSPQVCCTFNEFTNCSRAMSQSLCSSEGAEFVDQYLDRFGDATLTPACKPYHVGSELCPRSGAAPGRTARSLTMVVASMLPILLLSLLLSAAERAQRP
ncbi:uncharacterized protein LOC122394112 [Amphibalanus amphitrite]|uniref:uncharacterized protein LOC122394112 n=1 Tax=Amphibalanus amphitrite TaxID=1232801 RepID=UPI001C924DA2|nr:uncharacterized protein LOC122394112 [Amphibalanus amphitrite]